MKPMKLKTIGLMLLFLILIALIPYAVSLLAERLASSSRSDSYDIRVYTITHGEIER